MTTMLEKMAQTIAKVSEISAFGLYDYSHYPEVAGGLRAHVVRDEHAGRGKVVFESDSPVDALAFYDAACRRFVARAALLALREPDEAMKTAGEAVLDLPEIEPLAIRQQNAGEAFTAMIDAILDEKPTTQEAD